MLPATAKPMDGCLDSKMEGVFRQALAKRTPCLLTGAFACFARRPRSSKSLRVLEVTAQSLLADRRTPSFVWPSTINSAHRLSLAPHPFRQCRMGCLRLPRIPAVERCTSTSGRERAKNW